MGAYDRFGALIVDTIDVNDDDRARSLAIDDELLGQSRIAGDGGRAIDANGLTAARDQKQQRDAGIVQDIAQSIDAVVATAVGNEQRFFISNADKSGRIAAGRAIEPIRPSRSQREE